MQAYVYVGLTVVRRPSQKIRPKKFSPKKFCRKVFAEKILAETKMVAEKAADRFCWCSKII